jgi:hypothetical protein
MYYFHFKNDLNQEPIGTTNNCISKEDAIKYFAKLKDISIDNFCEIFVVKEIPIKY